ncbi:hypothetical protein JKP88DRAFT_265265 [Tribonema minus]|uniref:Thioredoxin domain-containing protein n=1 Tax=Tribonema minus TaxID=303371 RepID=A0A835YNV7_9STRA|nr:hypothetical protein JKP88DRAFT_265265 [Tribonema minus]
MVRWAHLATATLGCLGAACAAAVYKAVDPARSLVELTAEDLQSNLEFWRQDIAVMFYAPWCPHCKKFLPTWALIADDVKALYGTDDAAHLVGRFDCESLAHPDNAQFCSDIGIRSYPTFKVFGFGDFRDRSALASLAWWRRRDTTYDGVVEFRGLRYYAALRDWVRAMFGVSALQRAQARVLGLLGLSSALDPAPQLQRLAADNRVLRGAVRQLAAAQRGGGGGGAAAAKAAKAPRAAAAAGAPAATGAAAAAGGAQQAAGGAAAAGAGGAGGAFAADRYDDTLREDLFAVLAAGGYGDDALLACVADRAAEYCDALEDAGQLSTEAWCATLDACLDAGFEGAACRPAVCPFADVGCTHVAQCARDDLRREYAKAVEELRAAPATLGAAAASAK